MTKFVDSKIEMQEDCRKAIEKRKDIIYTRIWINDYTEIWFREPKDRKLSEDDKNKYAEIFRKKWKESQIEEEKHPRHIYLSNERQFTENL